MIEKAQAAWILELDEQHPWLPKDNYIIEKYRSSQKSFTNSEASVAQLICLLTTLKIKHVCFKNMLKACRFW